MTSKSATTLREIGITAAIMLVFAAILNFSDRIEIAPVKASAAEASGGGTNDNSASSTSVIVLSSLERLLQDEVNVSGAKDVEIFCAKNEYEAFQIIVVNPADKPVSQINLKTDNWRFTGTPGEGSPELTLYREHYIKVDKSSPYLKSKLGMYPDALIPFIDPYTGKEINNAKYLAKNQDAGPHKSQGYWVDVHVGTNVKAGVYTNEIKVLAGSNVIKSIPIKLTVWDFELPKRPAWTAWFCGLRRGLGDVYGLTNPSAEYDRLMHRHATFLYEHGVYPNVLKHPRINKTTGDVTFSEDYTANMKAFIDEFGTGVIKIPTFASNDPKALSKYFAAYDAFSKANPWAGQYIYYIDEPSTPEQYNFIKQCGNIIHTFAPSVKLLVTEQIAPQKPDWPSLEGAVDIWVQSWALANVNDIKRRQAAGDEVWSYTALTHTGFTNWMLDSQLVEYRTPAWFSYSLGLKGILYWSTTVWALPYIDAWTIPVTYRNKAGYAYNGAGSLLYPGVPVGIQGPIPSMRLKVFRDSVEDYDYLKLLESLTSRDQAVSLASSIAKDFKTFDTNPASYIAKRKAVAEMILKQKGKHQ